MGTCPRSMSWRRTRSVRPARPASTRPCCGGNRPPQIPDGRPPQSRDRRSRPPQSRDRRSRPTKPRSPTQLRRDCHCAQNDDSRPTMIPNARPISDDLLVEIAPRHAADVARLENAHTYPFRRSSALKPVPRKTDWQPVPRETDWQSSYNMYPRRCSSALKRLNFSS